MRISFTKKPEALTARKSPAVFLCLMVEKSSVLVYNRIKLLYEPEKSIPLMGIVIRIDNKGGNI